jgi:hypothetical protein
MNSLLQQRLRQFLVHSYLYYKLDESIISDIDYDRICMELKDLLKKNPDEDPPFRKFVEKYLGNEASGYSISQYPPTIISASMHLLYQHQYRQQMSFPHFLERFGAKIKEEGNG